MSSSPSSAPISLSCGAGGNTDDEACEPDHFCLSSVGTPRCVHCAFCSVMPSGCPSRCSCTSHDQCGPNSYCGTYDSSRNVCTSCEMCQDGRRAPFDGGSTCPDQCFCESSNECEGGMYCQRQRPGAWVPDNKGLCISCASEIGCTEHLILPNITNQTCRELCPFDFECTRHDECVQVGSWCSTNHRCNNCSQACWTEQRLLESTVRVTCDYDCNATELLEDKTSDLLFDEWTELPYLSIDYSCPEACCDWGMKRPENSRATSFTVGPCNSTTNVHGAWYDGNQLKWNSTQDFLSQSNPCQRIQYEFDEGFPRVVSEIVCKEVIPPCQNENRTLALLVTNETHTVFAGKNSTFPFVESYDDTGFTCVLEVAASDISASFFISLGILAVVFVLIIFYLLRRSRKS